MPYVTFIVPTLNRPTLKRTIDSLHAQTDPDWEALVGGDGVAPDTSLRDPDDFWRIDMGMVGHEGVRQGAGLTRNALMYRYTIQSGPASEWLAFVDDDDWLEPNYVSVLSEYSNLSHDIVVFRMRHPRLGIIPRLHDPTIRHGNVGISFAVSAAAVEAYDDLRFQAEDLQNEGPEGNEDIQFLLNAQKMGLRITVDPGHVLYNVGNPRTVRS